VQQTFDAFFRKALLPAPDRRATNAGSSGHLQHGLALVGVKNDARPLHMFVRTAALGDDGGEALAISRGEDDARGLRHAPRLARVPATVNLSNASVH
jgi:hypothetical protein